MTVELSSAPENLNVSLSSQLFNGATTTSSGPTALSPNTKTKVADLPYAGISNLDSLFPQGPSFDKNNDADFEYLSELVFNFVLDTEGGNPLVALYNLYPIEDEIQYCVESGYTYSTFFLTEVLFTSLFSVFDGGVDIRDFYYDGRYLSYQGATYIKFCFDLGAGDFIDCVPAVGRVSNGWVDDALSSGDIASAFRVLKGMSFTLSACENYGDSHFEALYNFCQELDAAGDPTVLCDEIEYFYHAFLTDQSEISYIQETLGVSVPFTSSARL